MLSRAPHPQDGAHKLEENVYYFGRTVEMLLLRFGKVPGVREMRQHPSGTKPRRESWSPWRAGRPLLGGHLLGAERLLGAGQAALPGPESQDLICEVLAAEVTLSPGF